MNPHDDDDIEGRPDTFDDTLELVGYAVICFIAATATFILWGLFT